MKKTADDGQARWTGRVSSSYHKASVPFIGVRNKDSTNKRGDKTSRGEFLKHDGYNEGKTASNQGGETSTVFTVMDALIDLYSFTMKALSGRMTVSFSFKAILYAAEETELELS